MGVNYLYCAQTIGQLGIKSFAQVKIKEITDKGVKFENDQGNEELLEVDTVIFALSRVPNNRLAGELEGKVSELYTLGDAEKPSIVHNAIHTAFALGKKI